MTAKGSVHGRIRSHVITRSRVKRESLAQKCTSLANQCLCALKSDRLLAMLTGYSRVRTHNHYVKDVLGGAAVGIASAAWLTHPLSDRTRAAVDYGGGGLAVHVSHQW